MPATSTRPSRQFSLRWLCALTLAAAALLDFGVRFGAERTLTTVGEDDVPVFCETSADGQVAILVAPAWSDPGYRKVALRHVWLPNVTVIEAATGGQLLRITDLDESLLAWRCEEDGTLFLLEEAGGRQRQRAWRLPAGEELDTATAAAYHARFAGTAPSVRIPVWRNRPVPGSTNLQVVERIRRCPLGCDLLAFWTALVCSVIAWRTWKSTRRITPA